MNRGSQTLLVMTIVCCLVPSVSFAQEHAVEFSAAYDRCMAADSSTQGMVACSEAERARWEKRLTTAYQSLLKKYADDDSDDPLGDRFKAGTTRVALLRAAERTWIAFRDANCQSVAATNGSISSVTYADCELRAVAERTVELDAALKDN